MKRILFLCFIFISLGGIVFSQNNIRLDIDLKTLNYMEESEIDNLIEQDVIVAVDGLLSTVSHSDIDKDGEIEIILSIINGKWIGTEEIEVFKCRVILEGVSWTENFPERMPRNPGEEIIQVNSYILILGGIIDIEQTEEGKVFVILAEQLRVVS